MAIFYTNWDCAECKTVNRNDDHYCKKCGTKKPENPNYYLPEDAQEVVDEKHKEDAKIDVAVCGNCGMHNKVTREFCLHCGHIMTKQLDDIVKSVYIGASEKEVVEENDLVIDKEQDNRYNDENKEYVYDGYAHTLKDKAKQEVKYAKPKIFHFANDIQNFIKGLNFKIIAIIILNLAFFYFIYWLGTDTERQMQVNQMTWSSKRDLEELKTFNESDWGHTAQDAYNITKKMQYHHSEDSLIGYETQYYYVNEVCSKEPYQYKYTEREACGSETYQESYTERESCGTETYQESYTEREACGKKINSNGYAETTYCNNTKYRTKSRTKYCNNTKYRTKSRTKYCDVQKTETRYRNVYCDVKKSKQVPKYRNVKKYRIKYFYTIDRWIKVDIVMLQGIGKTFKEVAPISKDKVRTSSAINIFSIEWEQINCKDCLSKTIDYSQTEWNSFEKNQIYIVKTSKLGKFELQHEPKN